MNNKIIISFLLTIAVVCLFCSCSDDASNNSILTPTPFRTPLSTGGIFLNPVKYDNGYEPAISGSQNTNVVVEIHQVLTPDSGIMQER